MKYRNSIFRMAGTVCVALFAAACTYDDALHNTPHPDAGVVVVENYDNDYPCYVKVDEHYWAIEGDEYCCPRHFDEGCYLLGVFNLPDGMKREGDLILVDRLADNTLVSQPGTLYASCTNIEVVKDDTLRVSLPMQQRTRQLTLKLVVTTGAPEKLAAVEARLTGIASALRLTDMSLAGEAAHVLPDFTADAGADAYTLSATLNLLGVMPQDKQILTIALTNRDGQKQSLGYDLSEVLKNFNTATTPLQLDADLKLMTEGDFNFTISDWTEGESDGADAV